MSPDSSPLPSDFSPFEMLDQAKPRIIADAHKHPGPDFDDYEKLICKINQRPDLNDEDKTNLIRDTDDYLSDELKQEAKQRLQEHPNAKKLLSEAENHGNDADDLFDKVFADNDGAAIGDMHNSKAIHQFIQNELPHLKKLGLKCFAVGEFPSNFQNVFDSINRMGNTKQRLQLFDNFIRNIDPDYRTHKADHKAADLSDKLPEDDTGMFDIIRKAVELHIDIRCVDSPIVRYVREGFHDIKESDNKSRIQLSNFDISTGVNEAKTHLPKDGKILLWNGAEHLMPSRSGFAAELSNLPTIGFSTSDKTHPTDSYDATQNHVLNLDYTIYLADKYKEFEKFYKILLPKGVDPNNLPKLDTSKQQEVNQP